LTDFVSVTPQATARILNFLSCHRSTADHALWFGSPSDDRLLVLPDKGYQVSVDSYWMLRILDVEAALAARGYPEVEGEVVLDVHDPMFRDNHGWFRLAVAGGRGEVTRGERGVGVRIGVRALAALYTGFSSVTELSRAGLVEGDARSLSTLGLFFTNTAPALCDFF
jgi:predicted acetyltransferase